MASPSPLHRHQSSLEGVIDFSVEPPLRVEQRTNAEHRFRRIVKHFEDSKSSNNTRSYSRPKLVRLTYEFALSDESRDNFLRAFFRAMALSMDGSDELNCEELGSLFVGFADHLLDHFFLPLRASTKKTPQPSPAYHSAFERVQGESQGFAGTTDRLSALRGACLIRDRHRCVISRRFDLGEARGRTKRDGDNARDDDGILLREDTNSVDVLEVAHILPHSLTRVDTDSKLNPSKQAALAILNMFDVGIIHLIDGTDIDRPRNAITLTNRLHNLFGDFEIFFEPTLDQQPHTYQIKSFYPAYLLRDLTFPITRTLYLTDTRTIDPPSPRLLAVHRAIAHILHLSAAGDYIDTLLRDMEENNVRADGSTELVRFVNLRLGGWLDNTIHT